MDYNIFEGVVCHGVPLVVITQGRVVLEDGKVRFKFSGGLGRVCNDGRIMKELV